jgi:hypothetical protein
VGGFDVKGKRGEDRLRKLVRAYWQYNTKRNPNITGIWITDNFPFRRGFKRIRIQAGLEHCNSIKKEKPKMSLAVRRWFLAEGTKGRCTRSPTICGSGTWAR